MGQSYCLILASYYIPRRSLLALQHAVCSYRQVASACETIKTKFQVDINVPHSDFQVCFFFLQSASLIHKWFPKHRGKLFMGPAQPSGLPGPKPLLHQLGLTPHPAPEHLLQIGQAGDTSITASPSSSDFRSFFCPPWQRKMLKEIAANR